MWNSLCEVQDKNSIVVQSSIGSATMWRHAARKCNFSKSQDVGCGYIRLVKQASAVTVVPLSDTEPLNGTKKTSGMLSFALMENSQKEAQILRCAKNHEFTVSP